jgi:ribosomal protein L7/L12
MPTDQNQFDEDELDDLLRAAFAAKGKTEASKRSGAERGEALSESEPVDPNEDHVLSLLEGGRKIEAIRLYRSQSGVGLKEATDYVEALATKYGISPKGAGCAGMVLLIVLASAIIGIGVLVVPG